MTLQEMRASWRPRLGQDARWMVVGSTVAGFLIILIRPETGASIAAVLGLVYGYVASLAGIRQWGKNAGVVEGPPNA